jgi:transposase
LKWISFWGIGQRLGDSVHVCLEPTSYYHLKLALKLAEDDLFVVSIVNPRLVKHYAKSLNQRAKTDPEDSRILALYCRTQRPAPWQPPREIAYLLRSIARQIHDLTKRRTGLKNRLHSARHAPTAACVLRDMQSDIRGIKRRLDSLQREALKLIKPDDALLAGYKRLLSVTGIGKKTAIRILGELSVMPDDLEKKQLVAAAGLDLVARESGISIHGKRRISKQGNAHLRGALSMPALVAIRHCAEVKGYYEHLLARGCAKLAAVCAVMRKLLQAIWGMFQTNTMFRPELFYRG